MTKKYAKFLPCTEEFNLENFPYYWVTQVHAQYVVNVDHALKKYGVDNSRRRILLALKAKPHASVSDLSEMVDTYSCEDDARITRVVLTEKGHEMFHKINDLTNIVLEQSFEGLTPLQIEKTMESLRHIFKNLAR